MTMTLAFTSVLTFLLVFARLTAMLMFNPLFSRVNIPNITRMGLVFVLSLLLAPLQPAGLVEGMSDVIFLFSLVREVFIGLVYGFVFQIFYYMLFFAGDMMDTDMGVAMAKTFDPATSIQTSFSGGLLTMLFALYIFASGSHLALIRIFAESFRMIPIGTGGLSVTVAQFVIKLFSSIFLLALRIWAPFMVAEFILQASMGILMKFIPQITVFVINFQLRILLGLLMLFLFAPLIGNFIDNYIGSLFTALADIPLAF